MISKRKAMRVCTIILILLLISGCSTDNTSFLEDRADLLSAAEREHLVDYNRALLQDLDIHFKLIILDSLSEDINREATELFGNLGEKTHGAKGLLFLVDPLGKQARIEVGYDLEGVFPDIFVGYLEREQMVPFFNAGTVGIGIEATTELLVTRAQQDMAGHRFDLEQAVPDLSHFSGGGGAKIETGIGQGQIQKDVSEARDSFQPQASPEGTLQQYIRALTLRIKDPMLPIFTPETRKFFSNWVVTDAQQAHELLTITRARHGEYRIASDYGILRYPIMDRTHPPFFFTKGERGWMLDFATMSRVIQMNHKNMWMMKSTDHPYMFAFSDWRFDKNGFPEEEK